MASGKTEEMKMLTRSFGWYRTPERPVRERDRSLRGKARKRARKEANRG